MLRVRLLGELAAERDSEPVPLPPGRRLRALLGWLALHPGPQPRGDVAGRLWPDVLDESARTSLRSALAELRRTLDGDWLAADRDTVGLADGVVVDLREFEALAGAGRPEEALALVRGELLEGLSDEWVYGERDRQRERERELLSGLAETAAERGDLGAAVGFARRRLDLDPLAEDAGRALIRLLAAAGDRSAALAVYARLADRLRRELGLAPGAETRRLVDELRTAGAAVADLSLPPLLAGRHRSPFVGRTAALARLRRAWGAARSGERRLVLVAGDPGIGKTRLAGELARVVRAGGGIVLYGRSHADAIAPYEPFTEALRPLLAGCTPEESRLLAGPLAGELVRLVPDRADSLPPLGSAPLSDPEGARYRLFEACASLLAGIARTSPVLVLLEDLHWADSSSLAMLRHLARGAPAPICLVGTYRATETPPGHPLHEALGALRREPGFEAVGLEGLGDDDVGRLAASWLGAERPTPGLTRTLTDATGGNPLFVEEVLRELESVSELPETIEGAPEGVRDVVGERVELLDADARLLLRVATVAGGELDVDVIAAVAGLEPDALAAALEQALRAHLLHHEPGRAAGYSFRHALIREAIYDRLSAPRRALLHERVAAALERRLGDDAERHLEVLAHHYARGGAAATTRAKAAGYAERAGGRAADRLAYEEAAQHYELALDALTGPGTDPRRRAELACRLGEARTRAAGLEAARPAFDEAAALARDAEAPELLSRAALGRSGLGVVVLAPTPETVELLEDALEARGDADPAFRSRLQSRLAVELYHVSEERREALSAEAVELARRADDHAALAEALSARHIALWSPPHLAERLAIVEEMAQIAEAAGDRERALQACNWLVTDRCEQGSFGEAGEAIDEHARRADELRLPGYQWWAPTWRAMLAIADGRFADAERLGAEAHEIGQRTNEPTEVLFGWYQALYVRSEREPPSGDLPDYVPEPAAVPAAEQAFRAALPAIYAEARRPDAARAVLDELARNRFAALPCDFNRLSSIALLSRGVALLDDAPRARELYELLLPYRERAILVGRAGLCHGPADLYLGLLAATDARWDAAEGHYRAARDWAGSAGAGLFEAWARAYWAETLRSRAAPGDLRRARSLATGALRFADERGLGRLAARAAVTAHG